jgi:hypothetical protein
LGRALQIVVAGMTLLSANLACYLFNEIRYEDVQPRHIFAMLAIFVMMLFVLVATVGNTSQ